MWSIGCIFAELLGRRPLFAGHDFLHQLQLICDVIGSPSDEEIAHVEESSAGRCLREMSPKPKMAWRDVKGLRDASDRALDLLDKLCTFDPSGRITASKNHE